MKQALPWTTCSSPVARTDRTRIPATPSLSGAEAPLYVTPTGHGFPHAGTHVFPHAEYTSAALQGRDLIGDWHQQSELHRPSAARRRAELPGLGRGDQHAVLEAVRVGTQPHFADGPVLEHEDVELPRVGVRHRLDILRRELLVDEFSRLDVDVPGAVDTAVVDIGKRRSASADPKPSVGSRLGLPGRQRRALRAAFSASLAGHLARAARA